MASSGMKGLLCAVAIWFVFTISPARAQQISVFGGRIADMQTHEKVTVWEVDYSQKFGEHFAYSLSYLNEGHFIDHHRDGLAFQLWWHVDAIPRKLSFSAGLGPYYYFDTTERRAAFFRNEHGVGAIAR